MMELSTFMRKDIMLKTKFLCKINLSFHHQAIDLEIYAKCL